VVGFRAKIVNRYTEPGMLSNPLPHFGGDNTPSSIGIWHCKDDRKSELIECSQELVNLLFRLLIFESNGMKCHEKK
jgi:hypothetical protein